MAGVITTGTHPKALWPGIKAWWGQTYDEHPEEYIHLFDKILHIKTTRKTFS